MPYQCYDWVVSKSNDVSSYDEIRAWCLTNDNTPTLLRIANVACCGYLEFPSGALKSKKMILDIVNALKYLLAPKDTQGKKDLERCKEVILKIEIKQAVTYLYESRQGECIYIEVVNDMAMRLLQTVSKNGGIFINKKKIPFSVWEADIPMHVKLLAQQRLGFCQWFTTPPNGIEKVHEDDKISKLEHEYWLDSTSIQPVPATESDTWVTSPRMLSFDIECYSSNPKRLPVKEAVNDVITMISCLYVRNNDMSTLQRYIIVNGECNAIDGVHVICCKNELDVLQKFLHLINELDPEVLIGYNTSGFDIPYIDMRMGRKFMTWGNTSRIKNQEPFVRSRTTFSEAYGYQTTWLLENMEGRIHFDLMSIVKRSEKLRKYSLDFVANHYIKESKHDVSPQEMFAIYKQYRDAKTPEERQQAIIDTTCVASYCVQDSELVLKLFHKLTVWIGCIEMCNVVHCVPGDLYTRGQQIKCKAQVYTAAFHQGYIVDYKGTAYDYKGAYVREPIPNIYDNVLGLDFASLYPSIIQAYNICYTTFIDESAVTTYKDDQLHIFDFEEDFEKKVDKDSKEAKQYIQQQQKDNDDNDDASSYDTDDGSMDEDVVLDKSLSRSKKVTIHKKVHYHFRYVKKDVKEGLVPMIVRKLVQERKAVRGQMKSLAKNSLMYTILDKRQLALKVSANSMYGFLGVKNGLLPFIQGAITVTYMGRVSIGKVNDYLISQGYKVVYNDTDSSYVDANIKDSKECYEVGKRLSKEVSALFPPPMMLEFEKPFRMLAIKCKKYAYVEIDENGAFERDKKGDILIHTKGITTARRDNCTFLTDNYYQVLLNVMTYVSVMDTARLIFDAVESLLNDKVDITSLSINKSLGSNYKSDTASMKVFGDYLKEQGRAAEIGERLDFVIVDTGDKKSTQGKKMRLLEMYLDNNQGEQIDKMYYIKNVFAKPVEQLYEIGYNYVWKNIPSTVGFKRGTRKHRSLWHICSYIVDCLEQDITSIQQIKLNYLTLLATHYKKHGQ